MRPQLIYINDNYHPDVESGKITTIGKFSFSGAATAEGQPRTSRKDGGTYVVKPETELVLLTRTIYLHHVIE